MNKHERRVRIEGIRVLRKELRQIDKLRNRYARHMNRGTYLQHDGYQVMMQWHTERHETINDRLMEILERSNV